MNIYVNGFHLSKKIDNSEVVINFTQAGPNLSFSPDDANVTDKIEIVGSYVMNPRCAQELFQKLAALLEIGESSKTDAEAPNEE